MIFKGFGTDEIALIDLICTKSNAQIMQLKNAYMQSMPHLICIFCFNLFFPFSLLFLLIQVYHRNVESQVRGDVSGYFQRILVSLLNVRSILENMIKYRQ